MNSRSQAENYWPEPCAFCGGGGKLPQFLQKFMEMHGFSGDLPGSREIPDCIVCRGKAFVLVLQPARKCEHCAGTGRTGVRCQICNGTGWMFVLNEN